MDMDQHVNDIVEHIAKSHEEIARILEAGKDITVHMSYLISTIPDKEVSFHSGGRIMIAEHSGEIMSNVTSYLNSIGDLQEACANSLTHVVKQLSDSDEE
jgi:uncharacterized protein YlzI (FlbEa/FlbD family)